MREWRKLGDIVSDWYGVPTAAIDELGVDADDGLRLGEKLVRLGILSEGEVMRALAHQLGVPILCSLDAEEIPWRVRQLVPLPMCARRKICPMAITEDGGVVLAMVDPTDFETMQDVQRIVGTKVYPVIAPQREVTRAIEICAVALAEIRRLSTGGVVITEEVDAPTKSGVIPLGLPVEEASTLV